jgi:hypothetical protein
MPFLLITDKAVISLTRNPKYIDLLGFNANVGKVDVA